jgi:hypothetical protein
VRNGSVVNIRNFYKTIIKQKNTTQQKQHLKKQQQHKIKQRTSAIQAQTNPTKLPLKYIKNPNANPMKSRTKKS